MQELKPSEFEHADVIDGMNDKIDELKDSPIYTQAQRQAEKFMRKNRREWKRLHQRAEVALMSGDKESYSYAVKKMRDMLKQPYNEQLIDTMWNTSRNAVFELLRKASEKQAA